MGDPVQMFQVNQIQSLAGIPGSMSINNGFVLKMNTEISYVIKVVPYPLSIYRLHPNSGDLMECFLRTYIEWNSGNQWVGTLRKIDVLHIYSITEQTFVQQYHQRHFNDGTLRLVTIEEMNQYEGMKYYPNVNLFAQEGL